MLAPIGRDGPLTVTLLASAGLSGHVCADMDELCRCFEQESAAALMVAEEALSPRATQRLQAVLERQSAWSDIPILVFIGTPALMRPRPSTQELLASLGNVTLLERPLRPITMLSAARSALRARKRQYSARAELIAQQQAVKLRDQFLAMLGHELRNPLSAISLALSLEPAGDGAQQREIMIRQVAHLTRLVDDLLDVSRVTSGKVALKRETLDLVRVAERCLAALTPLVRAQGSSLRLEHGDAPLWVRVDPVRIDQIIGNLVTNAAKYTSEGGIIQVSLSATSDEAVIAVRDSGVGIAPEMLGRVFDLFAQVEGSLDRAKGGMGIGLTLVRSLVELHEGTVHAHSDGLGQGSLFTVRLPRARPPSQTAQKVAESDGQREAPRGFDVLVVEDNHDSRELLTMLLTRRGHRVFSAADGPSGVEEALQRRPHVLLIDIGLPGLDGYEVARRVRAALGEQVLLVAVSGYGQPEDRRRALAAGFDRHLTKPLDAATLDAIFRARQQSSTRESLSTDDLN